MAVLIFKPTERCNANCAYCEVTKKRGRIVMDDDLLETVFVRINEYLVDNPTETMSFTWHGGEAGLLGAEYFAAAKSMQDRTCPDTGRRIYHLIQSNLTVLKQEHVDAFRGLGIDSVGSSYECVPNIRGYGKFRDSDAYNLDFMAGADLLNRNRIEWGVIYVVHRRSLATPLEIFHHLSNLNPRCPPIFHPVKVVGPDEHDLRIDAEEFADFLGAIFPVWWANRARYRGVQPFQWYVDNLIEGKRQLVCEISGECSNRWFYIGPEGEASHCGIAGDYAALSYGNIRDRSVEDILMDPQRDAMKARPKLLREGPCRECRFWDVCHGGCPVSALVAHGRMDVPAPSCDETKIFLERYFEPITGVRCGEHTGRGVAADVRC